jgi:hypothetical protein
LSYLVVLLTDVLVIFDVELSLNLVSAERTFLLVFLQKQKNDNVKNTPVDFFRHPRILFSFKHEDVSKYLAVKNIPWSDSISRPICSQAELKKILSSEKGLIMWLTLPTANNAIINLRFCPDDNEASELLQGFVSQLMYLGHLIVSRGTML